MVDHLLHCLLNFSIPRTRRQLELLIPFSLLHLRFVHEIAVVFVFHLLCYVKRFRVCSFSLVKSRKSASNRSTTRVQKTHFVLSKTFFVWKHFEVQANMPLVLYGFSPKILFCLYFVHFVCVSFHALHKWKNIITFIIK